MRPIGRRSIFRSFAPGFWRSPSRTRHRSNRGRAVDVHLIDAQTVSQAGSDDDRRVFVPGVNLCQRPSAKPTM